MRKFCLVAFCTCLFFLLFQISTPLEAKGKPDSGEESLELPNEDDEDGLEYSDKKDKSAKESSELEAKSEESGDVGSEENRDSGSGESKVFVCPKCGFQSDAEGSCPACNKNLVTPEDNPLSGEVPESLPIDHLKIGKDTYVNTDDEDED